MSDQRSNSDTANTTIRISKLSFDRGIPKAVRAHGQVIDPSLLEPGDLILVCKKKSSWISSKIQQYQAEMFATEDSRWHHAIVSGGNFEICEATTTGVKAIEYWHYMTGEYDLKIRRLKGATAQQRSLIAYYAATMVRTSYGFLTIFAVRDALSKGHSWQRTVFRSKGVICSQLYFEACMRVGFLLVNIPQDRVCPAHLSASTQMDDLPLRWVPV